MPRLGIKLQLDLTIFVCFDFVIIGHDDSLIYHVMLCHIADIHPHCNFPLLTRTTVVSILDINCQSRELTPTSPHLTTKHNAVGPVGTQQPS